MAPTVKIRFLDPEMAKIYKNQGTELTVSKGALTKKINRSTLEFDAQSLCQEDFSGRSY